MKNLRAMKRIVSIIAVLILSATAFSVDSFADLGDNSNGWYNKSYEQFYAYHQVEQVWPGAL